MVPPLPSGPEGAVEQAEADGAHARVPPLPVFGCVHALVFGGVQEARPPVGVSPVRSKTRRSTNAEPPAPTDKDTSFRSRRQFRRGTRTRRPRGAASSGKEATSRPLMANDRVPRPKACTSRSRSSASSRGAITLARPRTSRQRASPQGAWADHSPAKSAGSERPSPTLTTPPEVVLAVEQALADHEVVAGGGQVVGTGEDPVGRPGEGRAQVPAEDPRVGLGHRGERHRVVGGDLLLAVLHDQELVPEHEGEAGGPGHSPRPALHRRLAPTARLAPRPRARRGSTESNRPFERSSPPPEQALR